MTISFGDGDGHKEIKITEEGIHKVFGYPNGDKKTTPRPMNCNESMKVLRSELGFRNTEFTHSDLIKKLKLLVEIDREEENNKADKIFFLIFFNKVVYGTTFPRYSREVVMVKDINYEDMAQMDFCQVIIETIQAGAIDWQKMKKGEKENKDHLYGLAHGLVMMYLDSLLLPNTREMNRIAKKMNNTSTPRANYLDEKDLKKIAKEDMKKDGKGRPHDYEFGKIKVLQEQEILELVVQSHTQDEVALDTEDKNATTAAEEQEETEEVETKNTGELFLLPTAIGGFTNQKTIDHYVTIEINMKKQRFELLDSIKDYSEA
ncbi:hypothetical protein D1007_25027 [Hordeum vulgare]|nr:hypothetical protein D1007_25027 [Hordeum vulgare]